jgi:hypothetical protein
MAALITKAIKLCVESVDAKQPLAENNFKLVHVSGISENEEALLDEDLNIRVENAVKLVRKVEMYQWKQVEGTDSNGNTAAHYELCWSENLIDSSLF